MYLFIINKKKKKFKRKINIKSRKINKRKMLVLTHIIIPYKLSPPGVNCT